jgi:glycerophosphoryl diester phosphodiesterase
MAAAPLVIAHRGASGYLPEHTLESKALAYGQGADFIEQDVVATRDGELVVLHDLFLDSISNVNECFPGRARGDGRHYVVDFDLPELRQLRLVERREPGSDRRRYATRFPDTSVGFRVATLVEELELVQGLNLTTGKAVGVYPEIKDPSWHRAHGIDLARLLLDALGRFGYRTPDAPAFVQCFDPAELERVRFELGSRLRLVQLIDSSAAAAPLLTASGLASIAGYADAVGVDYELLLAPSDAGATLAPGPLAAMIRDAHLQIHPYTFRRDRLPAGATSFEALLELFFVEIGVDGIFCDFPDVAVGVRDRLRTTRRQHPDSGLE